MKAMVLERICDLSTDREPLRCIDMAVPAPGRGEVLIKVSACGVCHTELDEIEGRTPPPRLPVVPGHQIVGSVAAVGEGTSIFKQGDRVGVAWVHGLCGKCTFCLRGEENLCDAFEATGRDADGGYAEYTVVSERFAHAIPDAFGDLEATPLLCAGTVGYRSLRLANVQNGENIGLIGFGASAHLVIQMARKLCPSSKIFVFARSEGEREFARSLGAFWTGDNEDMPPEKIHRAIDTTPVWGTVLKGLENLEKGGRLVINAIRKEKTDQQRLLDIDYPRHLWLEKEIKSVANVTVKDVKEFLELAAAIPIRVEVQVFPLHKANEALMELKEGRIKGAKVLSMV